VDAVRHCEHDLAKSKVCVKLTFVSLLTLLLSGCASLGGSDLVPGKSTAADAEARMGRPDQRLTLANGDSALYFSRLPYGRAMHVVTVGTDGAVKTVEQRMQYATFARVVANTSMKKEVSELLGPPGRQGRLDRQRRDWWEYRYFLAPDHRVVWIQFSDDGVVREMIDTLDPDEERKKDGPGQMP
jgi:hypothetical protein